MTLTRVLLVALGSLIVGVTLWFFGADLLPALSAAVILAGSGILALAVPDSVTPEWRDEALFVEGTRHDVERLSWSLHSRGGFVRETAVNRVDAIARRELIRNGLDLDRASDQRAISALIGRQAYSVLDPTRSDPVTLRRLTRCLDAIDSLSEERRKFETSVNVLPIPDDRRRP